MHTHACTHTDMHVAHMHVCTQDHTKIWMNDPLSQNSCLPCNSAGVSDQLGLNCSWQGTFRQVGVWTFLRLPQHMQHIRPNTHCISIYLSYFAWILWLTCQQSHRFILGFGPNHSFHWVSTKLLTFLSNHKWMKEWQLKGIISFGSGPCMGHGLLCRSELSYHPRSCFVWSSHVQQDTHCTCGRRVVSPGDHHKIT